MRPLASAATFPPYPRRSRKPRRRVLPCTRRFPDFPDLSFPWFPRRPPTSSRSSERPPLRTYFRRRYRHRAQRTPSPPRSSTTNHHPPHLNCPRTNPPEPRLYQLVSEPGSDSPSATVYSTIMRPTPLSVAPPTAADVRATLETVSPLPMAVLAASTHHSWRWVFPTPAPPPPTPDLPPKCTCTCTCGGAGSSRVVDAPKGEFEFVLPKVEPMELQYPFPPLTAPSWPLYDPTKELADLWNNLTLAPLPSVQSSAPRAEPTSTPTVPLLIPKIEPPDIPPHVETNGQIQDIYFPPVEDPEAFLNILHAITNRPPPEQSPSSFPFP